MQPAQRHSFYYPELDGLRFVAFLLVFIHNAPASLPSPFFAILHEYGWIGVDLFLCLSGYLLTRLLLNENDRDGRFSVRNFYIRRVLRIWPLYFAFIGFAAVVTLRLAGWTPLTSLRLLGLATFTDDLMAVWLNFNTIAFAPHLWTISYEEQFYAVLPWALRWLLRRSKGGQWLAAAAVFASFLGLRALLIYLNAPYPAIYVLPVTHFTAILGGVLLGLGLLDGPLRKLPLWAPFLAAVAYLGLIVSLPNKDVPGWHLFFTYPGISMTLILYTILQGGGAVRKALGSPVLAHLGKISFGLYVFHFFGLNVGLFAAGALHISTAQSILFPLAILVIGLLVTWSYAELSYRFLETPFLRLKQRFTQIPSRPV